MPATKHMMSVIIIWIQLERALGVVADQPGMFDSTANAGVKPEFPVTNREREHVNGVVGLKLGGALRVGERFGAETFFLGRLACLVDKI